MDRFAIVITSLGLLTLIGCGRQSESIAVQQTTEPGLVADSATVASTPTKSTPNSPSPTDVVSQFLDEIRRGGEDSRANDLLTAKARAELARIGQSIQPIGSPDARFVVTRFENVPGEERSALVHSVWSEPNGDGTNSEFQVVWAVQQEQAGWRISGLAMELDPGQDPVIMDFENAELMSALLRSPENKSTTAAAEPASSQASATTPPVISR